MIEIYSEEDNNKIKEIVLEYMNNSDVTIEHSVNRVYSVFKEEPFKLLTIRLTEILEESNRDYVNFGNCVFELYHQFYMNGHFCWMCQKRPPGYGYAQMSCKECYDIELNEID